MNILQGQGRYFSNIKCFCLHCTGEKSIALTIQCSEAGGFRPCIRPVRQPPFISLLHNLLLLLIFHPIFPRTIRFTILHLSLLMFSSLTLIAPVILFSNQLPSFEKVLSFYKMVLQALTPQF